MAKQKQEIINNIKAYISKNGDRYREWYVGIASDPRQRLFNEHGVHQNGDAWICEQSESDSAAREIEKYFVETLGTDGGAGGGDYTSIFVYAYKKSSHTKP